MYEEREVRLNSSIIIKNTLNHCKLRRFSSKDNERRIIRGFSSLKRFLEISSCKEMNSQENM